MQMIRRNKTLLSLAIALVLVFGGVAYQSVFGESGAAEIASVEVKGDTSDAAATVQSIVPSRSLGALTFLGPNTIADIAELAKESVVTIEAVPKVTQRPLGRQYTTRDPFFDPFMYFFGIDPYGDDNTENYSTSSGTGFIFSEEGYILTNNHVIKGDKTITVTLADGTEYEATVVRSMSNPDVAVLKIEPAGHKLVPLKLGDSSEVRPGEWAIAIGNPLNLGITVTAGIISATHRGDDPTIREMFASNGIAIPPDGFIQTDAAISPGNSGGPLLNLWGEVIGINTAMAVSGENVGFAIPINAIADMLPKLMTASKGGYLGIEFYAADEDYARRRGVPVNSAVVANVIKGYPAEKAGLRRYDVIVAVDGEEISSVNDLSFVISSHAPGDEIEITFIRDNTIKVVTVTLTEAPKQ